LLLIACLLVLAPRLLAHAPYEVPAGTFTRSDGRKVTIVKYYVDGIFGGDPVSVKFRLADGSEVAQTELTTDTTDATVRHTTRGIEIYQFPSGWIPLARRIDLFDGFALTEITAQRNSWDSFMAHMKDHWREYAVLLGAGAALVALFFALHAVPSRGTLKVLRVLGFVCLAVVAGVYCLVVLVVSSPPIVLVFLLVLVFAILLLRFIVRRYVKCAQISKGILEPENAGYCR
jgi:hypothetical protein